MRLTYGSSILKFGVWEHGFTTRIWLEACTISQAGRFFTVNKFWLLFKCKMSIRPLCPALRLQCVLSHHLCFVCLGLPPKSDFLHPVLLQGVGSPLLSGSNFGRARGTARAPTRAYLLYGYHYFIYILLFIYIYIFFLIDIYVSYFTDILLWHHDCLPQNTKLEQFLQLSVIWVKVKNPFFLFLLRTVTEKVLPDMERGSESCG